MSEPPHTLARLLYERMRLIRRTEETLLRLFAEGKLAGTTHTSIGQEAIAAAAAAHLRPGDKVFSSHRCHGHYLACGGSLAALFGEVMGRENGACAGRGGSQHLHFEGFHANGVQGGIAGNATGAALALKRQGAGNIALVFLGDGTLGEGLVYESLNFAALHRLPVLFLLENNRYAQTTPIELAVSGGIEARAEAFGIPTHAIESNDALELYPLLEAAAAQVRAQGPFFQVVHTYRLAAHSKGDDFRDPGEIAAWRAKDPMLLLAPHIPESERAAVDAHVETLVAEALAEAEAAPPAMGPIVAPPRLPEAPPPFPTEEETFVHALNRGLAGLLRKRDDAFLLGQDLLDPYGGAFAAAKGLSTAFPDKVIPAPISEAGIVAWGAGAALCGMRPILEIMFGDFLALAADQLLNHVSKYRWMYNGKTPANLVLRTPMGGGRGYGPTHSQCIEAMFLGMPGLLVIAPNPFTDPGALLERALLETDAPALFIEHKGLYPQALRPVTGGRSGEWFVRATAGLFPTLHLSLADFAPPDAVIVTYGGMVPAALEAAETLLIEDELTVDLALPSLLSPLPAETIANAAQSAPLLVTLEEGQAAAGFGAEVIAALLERAHAPAQRALRIAAAPCPVPAARSLETRALPNRDAVVAALRKALA